MNDLETRLGSALTDLASDVHASSDLETRAHRAYRRRQQRPVLVASVAAVAAVGVGAAVLMRDNGTSKQHVATQPTVETSTTAATSTTAPATSTTAAVSTAAVPAEIFSVDADHRLVKIGRDGKTTVMLQGQLFGRDITSVVAGPNDLWLNLRGAASEVSSYRFPRNGTDASQLVLEDEVGEVLGVSPDGNQLAILEHVTRDEKPSYDLLLTPPDGWQHADAHRSYAVTNEFLDQLDPDRTITSINWTSDQSASLVIAACTAGDYCIHALHDLGTAETQFPVSGRAHGPGVGYQENLQWSPAVEVKTGSGSTNIARQHDTNTDQFNVVDLENTEHTVLLAGDYTPFATLADGTVLLGGAETNGAAYAGLYTWKVGDKTPKKVSDATVWSADWR